MRIREQKLDQALNAIQKVGAVIRYRKVMIVKKKTSSSLTAGLSHKRPPVPLMARCPTRFQGLPQ
jgi:hypothetical protein